MAATLHSTSSPDSRLAAAPRVECCRQTPALNSTSSRERRRQMQAGTLPKNLAVGRYCPCRALHPYFCLQSRKFPLQSGSLERRLESKNLAETSTARHVG